METDSHRQVGGYKEGDHWSDQQLQTDALTKRRTDRQSEKERRKVTEADGWVETDRQTDERIKDMKY